MNKFGKRFLFLITILAFVLSVGAVSQSAKAVPVSLYSATVDGVDLDINDTTRLDIERGTEFTVKIVLLALSDDRDVEVEAYIAGYEHSDVNPISDSSGVFSMTAGSKYKKELRLKLPDNADRDNYKLRVLVSDRNSGTTVYEFNLQISSPRHTISIRDVVLSPGTEVEAGRALLATVRIKNSGEKDEEGVRVKVAIADLSLSESVYIDTLESDESTTTEEIFLRIPACAEAGTYMVRTTVDFNDGYERVSKDTPVYVTKGTNCQSSTITPPSQPGSEIVISVGADSNDLIIGEGGAIYPLTITNNGKVSRTFTLNLEGAEFADFQITPSNVLVVNAGESKTFYTYLSAKTGFQPGLRTFVADIKTDSTTLKQIALKANLVQKQGASWSNLTTILMILFIILLAALFVTGLVFVLSKPKSRGRQHQQNVKVSKKSEVSEQDYY